MEEFKIIKPFGPTIVKVKIPDEIINDLNNYIDQIIDNEKKSSELDAGKILVGDVTQEFLLEKDIMQKSGWEDFLEKSTNKWIEVEFKKKLTKFVIKDSWVVRQFQNEYNPVHWHDGHISGAGFLKVPESLGDYYQKEKKTGKDYLGGNLNLIHGSKMFLSESLVSIKPEVGDFYFFPNYLMHTVYPFKETNEERRSISFNGTIDPEVYNIYLNN